MSAVSQSCDDPVGDAIARAAPAALATKAQQPVARMVVLAILAGAFIAFGSIASLVAQANMSDGGAVRILSGGAFSVGLMMVIIVGAELFTGNTMMILPTLTGDLDAGRMAGAWAVVWTGNLIGSVAIALLFHAAGGLSDGVGEAARALGDAKLGKSALATFSSAILANMLVCLAVWMAMGARTIPAKVLTIVGPVTIFVSAGLEHSIANMSILPLGWLAQTGHAPDLARGLTNLFCSTAGNIVGGAVVALGIAYGHDAWRKAE
ncbi:formate/nitrite transporter family protein [Sphingobium sp. HWE2-09]|uniref:formate/nitrite transporter family protein n=1 Tax=Sphingobium sp. HWE2-09 TaxID=3108390 RepID=UPI002DCB9879|nr:formate/nitrite transporter family protein [Sphingobium sp. HWE2-09]